jgi:formate-dependent phosphoribosylglycinamide formyltransferase (GAR transformylase)
VKTLLVLAAGDLQLPAIIIAKQMGLKVVAADADPNAPGMKLADVSCPFDITDTDRCLQVAREYGVDGAIQICSEVSMYPWGRINEELGLRGIDSHVAIRATNKEKMRRAFESRGVPSPRSLPFTTCPQAQAAVAQQRESGNYATYWRGRRIRHSRSFRSCAEGKS